MAKNWWFKLEWNDWLQDENLARCSFEAQGFWMRCICVMHRSDQFELTGTIDDLRRLLGCLPEEVTRCAHELKRTGAADVRFGNGEVSIKSRRLEREHKARELNRLYVAKHRGKEVSKESVRTQSKSKSLKQEKEEEEDVQNDAPLSFAESVAGGIKSILGTLQLPNETSWFVEIERAERDGRSVEHCIEVFDLMHKQKWRTSAIKPETWYATLPILNKLRDEAENGSNQNGNRKRTDADVLEASRDFYDNYPS